MTTIQGSGIRLSLAQIRTELRALTGARIESGKDTDITSRIDAAIDLAQMRVARAANWDEFNKLTTFDIPYTGDTSVDKFITLELHTAITAVIRRIYSIRVIRPDDSRSKRLTGYTAAEFDLRVPDPSLDAGGFPEIFTRWMTTPFDTDNDESTHQWVIETYPIVDDDAYDMQVRWSMWPRSVTNLDDAGSDSLDFAYCDDIIIHAAASYLHTGLGNIEKGKHYFGIYSALLQDAKDAKDTDFTTIQAAVHVDAANMSLGYNDPFVRSTSIDY